MINHVARAIGRIGTGDNHAAEILIEFILVLSGGGGGINRSLQIPVEANLALSKEVAQILEAVAYRRRNVVSNQLLDLGKGSNGGLIGQVDLSIGILEIAAVRPQRREYIVALAGFHAIGVGNGQAIDIIAKGGYLISRIN